VIGKEQFLGRRSSLLSRLDPKDVYVDTWAGPDTSNAAPAGTRILKAISFYMFERDGGSLWDRLDPTTLERDARFARELVVSGRPRSGTTPTASSTPSS
jgi:hypothetical protein